MKCPKCKSKMVGNADKYCFRCGYMENGKTIKRESESQLDQGNELIRKFIGKNSDSFFESYNWSAFFFETFYLLYRKCYLIGYILLLFEFLFLHYILSYHFSILFVIILFKIIIFYSFTEKKGYIIGYGILSLLILLVPFIFAIKGTIIIIIALLKSFIYYSFTNSIYIYSIKKKINKMNNNIIYMKGGSSIIYPIIGIIILIILFLVYCFINNGF